jgi:hypothetical protein
MFGHAFAGFFAAGSPHWDRERGALMEHFWEILTKSDNLPIAGMLLAVIFCLWVAFRQALKHDKLIEQGRKDEIYSEMIK